MHLMYYLVDGVRIYTLMKEITLDEEEEMDEEKKKKKRTISAHPARFSPDDKYSRQRVTVKRRFGILPTQLPSKPM